MRGYTEQNLALGFIPYAERCLDILFEQNGGKIWSITSRTIDDDEYTYHYNRYDTDGTFLGAFDARTQFP